MELEEATKKLKTLNQERYNSDIILSLYNNFIDEDEENQPYILTPFERYAIEVVLNQLTKQEKKMNELEKYKTYYEEMEEVNKKFIAVDKIKERIEQTKKVYEEEMKPYQREYGLDVTYLSKEEKEELINKRNCLLVQIKTYEMLLEENNE